ncbi:MAG: DUF4199 domain-containing protein [Bacteroidales bacterium]|jgi:hypothetical protein|nr:DUF4199 domain-containing protein [Bacteroidales bacterium]
MKSPLLKNSMNFGAMNGASIMIVSLLIYIIGIQQNLFISFIIYGLNIFFIVYGTKHLRDQFQNGQISYGKALGSGTLISLFMSILVAFFIFLFFKFIATDELEKIFAQTEERLYNQGMSEDQIEMAMQMTRKMTTPLTMAIGTIFSYTFMGFIFSLITSSFIKKNGESYQQIMNEIEKEKESENKESNE